MTALLPWAAVTSVFALSILLLSCTWVAYSYIGFGLVIACLCHVCWIFWVISYIRCIIEDPGRVSANWFAFYPLEAIVYGYREHKAAVDKPRNCSKCEVMKPPRCHHCSQCNRCVLRFDHHCIWINNCIGYRTIKPFMCMLNWAILALCLLSLHAALEIYHISEWKSKTVLVDVATGAAIPLTFYIGMQVMVEILLLIVTVVAVVPVWAYSLFGILRNVTMYERRFAFARTAKSPFDRGLVENWSIIMGNSLLWAFIPTVPKNDRNGFVFSTSKER